MKKILIILTTIFMFAVLFAGCGSNPENPSEISNSVPIQSSESTENSEATESQKQNNEPAKVDGETITLDSGVVINISYNKELMKTISGGDYTIASTDYNYEDFTFGFGVKMVDAMQTLYESGNLVCESNSDRIANVISYNYLTETEKNFRKDDMEKKLSKEELLEKYAGKFDNGENGTFAFMALFKYEKVTGLDSLYAVLQEDYKYVEKICEYGGNTYYFCYNNDYSGVTMSADDKAQAEQLIAALPTIRENLYIYLTK